MDDSAARIPLNIRSSDGVWDRGADLRNRRAFSVELATQHWLNTGVTLVEELAYYFENNEPVGRSYASLAAITAHSKTCSATCTTGRGRVDRAF